MRVTKKSLQSRVATLNMMLGRPVEMFASKVGSPTKFSPGHIALDKNMTGYQLEEQTGDGGAVHNLTGRMNGSEMALYLSGVIKGIGLRNQHIGEMMLRNELVAAGLCKEDHPLYNLDTKSVNGYEDLKKRQAAFAEAQG